MCPTDCFAVTWPDLVQRLRADGALTRWAWNDPELAEAGSIDELERIVHDRDRVERADVVLGALLRLAAVDGGNDPDAALLVVYLLDVGTRRLACALADLSGDIDAVIAGAVWVQIRTYPWRKRQRGHAKGVLLGARAAVLTDLCPSAMVGGERVVHVVDPVLADTLAGLSTSAPGSATEVTDAEQELDDVLGWAQQTGVLATDDVAFLLDVGRLTVPARARLARSQRVSERTLRRRCRRILATLRGARGAYLAQAA